jgi:hypothetical protein
LKALVKQLLQTQGHRIVVHKYNEDVKNMGRNLSSLDKQVNVLPIVKNKDSKFKFKPNREPEELLNQDKKKVDPEEKRRKALVKKCFDRKNMALANII